MKGQPDMQENLFKQMCSKELCKLHIKRNIKEKAWHYTVLTSSIPHLPRQKNQ